MVTPTNSILTGMAVCDVITCVFVVIRSCLEYSFPNMTYEQKINKVIIHLIILTSHTTSIWLSVLLSIFRFFIIRMYSSARTTEIWGLYRSRLAIVITSVAVIITFLPLYVTLRIRAHHEFNRTIFYATFLPATIDYNYAISSGMMKVAPAALLVFFGTLLLVTLHRADKRRMSLMEEARTNLSGRDGKSLGRRERNSRRTTRMLLAVIILFVCVELPNGILMCLARMRSYIKCVYQDVGVFFDLASLLKNAVTFVLYCSMSSEFRQTFRTTFCICGDARNPQNGGMRRGRSNGAGHSAMAKGDSDRRSGTTAAFVVEHLSAGKGSNSGGGGLSHPL